MSPLRALVTECLPYELPLEMANHWLYVWLDNRAVSVNPQALKIVARTRFDLFVLAIIGTGTFSRPARHGEVVSVRIDGFSSDWRAPASFRVRRDRARTRQLELLCIRSQLNIAFLYFKQKDVLLHYVSRDRTSLRHPARVNVYGKNPSAGFRRPRPDALVSVETTSRRIGTYNSYFIYEKYAFVGQFYDSREWHALEARWRFLRRLDVANCFRSIYTHSASWSTGTDFFSKDHLQGTGEEDLGQALDKTMQVANWGETHGICVGPEASRIFAEVVFQHLGIEMESRINSQGISHRKYEILRYVDDYFVFAADQSTLESVSRVIENTLAEHKFAINPAKTRNYMTPFTTGISVKKASLKTFLRTALPYDGPIPPLDDREISVHLKAMLVDSDDESATVGTSLTQVEKRLVKFLGKRGPNCKTSAEANDLSKYVWGFVHDMLFQYLSHPSVASAMKVVRVLRMYFLSPDLFPLPENEKAAARFRANEYVHFAITKAIERLAEVEDSDVEICHFLSLAGACGIRIEHSSKLTGALLLRISQSVPKSKGNQASIFLLLAVMKFYLSDDLNPASLRKSLLKIAQRTADEVLGRGYTPVNIKRHAIQEIFVLALATCPWLLVEEKLTLLRQPLVLEAIQDRVFGKLAGEKASARFLRRCLAEFDPRLVDDGSAWPTVFGWRNDHFDSLLYEKQPQFIY